MKMEKKILLVLFSVFLLFPIINAEESVSAAMYFKIIERDELNIEICHRTIDIGKDTICITDEGKFILIVTASIRISMTAIPSKENYSISYNDMKEIIEILKKGGK